jgi:hypothetical protein
MSKELNIINTKLQYLSKALKMKDREIILLRKDLEKLKKIVYTNLPQEKISKFETILQRSKRLNEKYIPIKETEENK